MWDFFAIRMEKYNNNSNVQVVVYPGLKDNILGENTGQRDNYENDKSWWYH